MGTTKMGQSYPPYFQKRILTCGIFVCMLTKAASTNSSSAVACTSDPSIMGYNNITQLNQDMLSDFESNRAGLSSAPYNYNLCPDTTFIIDNTMEPIVPLLDETSFTCGKNGTRDGNCHFKGGAFHLFFLDILTLNDIYFRGITFEGAEKASIYGDAHPASHVYFIDCHWKENVGIATAYILFTPYIPGTRRLQAGKTVKSIRTSVMDIPGYDSVNRKPRILQEDVRFSMGVIFRNCTFSNNDDKDATVLSVGGEVAIHSTLFINNTVTNYGIFTTLDNGHAYLGGASHFENNNAKLGPVFIDSDSYLQFSANNTGTNNYGGVAKCEGIFMEKVGTTCSPRTSDCEIDCCTFGDETCDMHEPESTPSPEGAKPPEDVVADPNEPNPSPTEPNPSPYSPYSSTTEDKETDSGSGGCNGFCLAFAVVFPLFIGLLVIVVGVLLRRRHIRKSTVRETSSAALDVADLPELNLGIS